MVLDWIENTVGSTLYYVDDEDNDDDHYHDTWGKRAETIYEICEFASYYLELIKSNEVFFVVANSHPEQIIKLIQFVAVKICSCQS